MEISSSIHEDSRYVSRSGPSKQKTKSQGRGEKRGKEDFAICVQDDEGRDQTPNVSDRQTTTWTHDVATQVHNLFCQAPCFVNTSSSMDNGNPPDNYNNRMEPPSSPIKDVDSEMADMAMQAHPPSPPIRFPSVHLDVEDWGGSGEEDDSGFFQPSNGNPIAARVGSRLSKQRKADQESIYRKRTSGNGKGLFPFFSRNKANFAAISCSASNASTVNTAATSKYGLHRSPAWSCGNEDSDEELESVGNDDDWHVNNNNGTPNYYNDHDNQYNHNKIASSDPGNQAVIDVTNMEDIFNDMSLIRTASEKR